MNLEAQIKEAQKEFRELYDPKTACGNVKLIRLNHKICELQDILMSTDECSDCDGTGSVDHDCDCDYCTTREIDCEECGAEGRVPKPAA